jgi:aspartate carbamoyltransferase catalytic subunit
VVLVETLKTLGASKPHLLSTEGLSAEKISSFLDYAERFAKSDRIALSLKGKAQINLFFEFSTRTDTSFETAGQRLGANVISIRADTTSVNKGETLLDTATTLNSMKPDILVVRHQAAGAVELLSQKVDCAIINAGDGAHQHPTQALTDALTIRQRCGSFKNLRVAICGDILHSRVARSNIYLLKTLGAHVRLVAPATLMPRGAADIFGVETFNHMDEGIKDCDIIMCLRLQQERMAANLIPSTQEYFSLFGLTEKKLALAKDKVLVMHPGPMNREIEIDSAVADNPDVSLISRQVENGIFIRMALLDLFVNQEARDV